MEVQNSEPFLPAMRLKNMLRFFTFYDFSFSSLNPSLLRDLFPTTACRSFFFQSRRTRAFGSCVSIAGPFDEVDPSLLRSFSPLLSPPEK